MSTSLRSALLGFSLVASACLASACGGGTGKPASGATLSAAPLPLGTYHLDQVDATNLDLRADGTYQWSIEGCDFGGGQCGTWKQDDAGNLLLTGGSAEIVWTFEGSFKQPMRTLAVKKDGEDVTVVGETKGGKQVSQKWKKGRRCAVCGGNVGPTGQEACDTPLPNVCGGG